MATTPEIQPVSLEQAESTGIIPNKNAILIWNYDTNQHDLAPRMADIPVLPDTLAYARGRAAAGYLEAGDASLACDSLHFEVKNCVNGCETHIISARCRQNLCRRCGSGKQRKLEFEKRMRRAGKMFTHERPSWLYTFTIQRGHRAKDYEELRKWQEEGHERVAAMFPQAYGNWRDKITKYQADVLDPKSSKTVIRVLYQPEVIEMHIPYRAMRAKWEMIGGLDVTCEWAEAYDCDKIDAMLLKLLSGLEPALMLPGAERAKLQNAFHHYRTIRTSGLEDATYPDEEEDLGCCQTCKAKLERSTIKHGQTLTELRAKFKQIFFSAGKTKKVIYNTPTRPIVDNSYEQAHARAICGPAPPNLRSN